MCPKRPSSAFNHEHEVAVKWRVRTDEGEPRADIIRAFVGGVVVQNGVDDLAGRLGIGYFHTMRCAIIFQVYMTRHVTTHGQKGVLRLQGVRAALFDMDGTMVNNNLYHKKAWQEFAKRHGKSVTTEDFKLKALGKQNSQILPSILDRDLNDNELEQLVYEKESLYRELYEPHVEAVEGLHDLIMELKTRDIKVAVATMAQEENRKFILKAIGLEHQFDVILDEDDFTNGKPDPEIFITAAKRLGVRPKQCLVFEDTPLGIQAARRAGMKAVGLLTFYTRNELKYAHLTIENFSKLILE